MVGRLTLDQEVGVRIPAPQPQKARKRGFLLPRTAPPQPLARRLCPFVPNQRRGREHPSAPPCCACAPSPSRRPRSELLRLLLSEKIEIAERVLKRDTAELAQRTLGRPEVPLLDRAGEASVCRVGSHEQMFAHGFAQALRSVRELSRPAGKEHLTPRTSPD